MGSLSPDQEVKSLNLRAIEKSCADEQEMSIVKKMDALNLKDDKQTFEVLLQVKQFRPSEINVKTAGRKVIVSAKHEVYADDHGFVSREFTRKYNLPNGVEPKDLVTFLSQDGILTIKTYDEKDLYKESKFLQDLEKVLNQAESVPAEGLKQEVPLLATDGSKNETVPAEGLKQEVPLLATDGSKNETVPAEGVKQKEPLQATDGSKKSLPAKAL